jgi:hypothetical protein
MWIALFNEGILLPCFIGNGHEGLKNFFPKLHVLKESNAPTCIKLSQILCHLHSYSCNSPQLQASYFCTLSEFTLTDLADSTTVKKGEKFKIGNVLNNEAL